MPETCLACGKAPVQSPGLAGPICGQCEQNPLPRLRTRGFLMKFEHRTVESEGEGMWIHVTAPEEVSSGVAAVLGPEKFKKRTERSSRTPQFRKS